MQIPKEKSQRCLAVPAGGRPELSAIETVWKDAKYRLVTSVFYDTLEHLKEAVLEYFRTRSIEVDIYKYLERSV